MSKSGALIWLYFWTVFSAKYKPQQVHIAFDTAIDTDVVGIVFNWVTMEVPKQSESVVRLSEHFNFQVEEILEGETHVFTDLGQLQTKRNIHVVKTSNLEPQTRYYYQVGDRHLDSWSSTFSFKSPPDKNYFQDEETVQKLIFTSDIGYENAQIVGSLEKRVFQQEVDLIIHAGDFAYNFYEKNGTTGDNYMNMMQNIAGEVPYMPCPGNHELTYNFSHYTQRFRGIENYDGSIVSSASGEVPNNWYYSFRTGLVQFIAIDTEIYFDFPWLIKTQYEWLENELKKANDNRNEHPWVIIYGHKSFYCTTDDHKDCTSDTTLLRNGVYDLKTYEYKYGLEDLLYKYDVDFYICGHEHNYERTYDLYQGKTKYKTTNMDGITHIITGNPGNREVHDKLYDEQPSWSAFRTHAYSYTKFDIHNATSIHLQQIMADHRLSDVDEVIDDVWYHQYKHVQDDSYCIEKQKDFGKLGILMPSSVSKYIFKFPQRLSPIPPYQDVDDRRVPYLGDDKTLYQGIPNVHF